MSREPKPLLLGATTLGPPVSVQTSCRCCSSRSEIVQSTDMRPEPFDSAPYLAAFVASSCTAIATASADFGSNLMSGPLTSNSRFGAMKGDRAFSTMSRRSAPSQFCCVSTSWAPAIESRRDSSAPLTVAGTVFPFRVWAATDCTVASVFFTR